MNILNNVYTNLRIMEEAALPASPVRGQIVYQGSQLHMWTDVQGLNCWVPLTNPRNSFIHQQVTASQEWVVNHMLGTNLVLYSVYDGNDSLIIANRETVDANTTKFKFGAACTGYVVMIADVQMQGLSSAIYDYIDEKIAALKIERNEVADPNDSSKTIVEYDLVTDDGAI
jgi:hypothetical protein